MKRVLDCGDDTSSPSDTSKKQKNTRPNLMYDTSYLKFGFVIKLKTENSENPIRLCVVRKETISNQSIKPTLLKRHQRTKHSGTII